MFFCHYTRCTSVTVQELPLSLYKIYLCHCTRCNSVIVQDVLLSLCKMQFYHITRCSSIIAQNVLPFTVQHLLGHCTSAILSLYENYYCLYKRCTSVTVQNALFTLQLYLCHCTRYTSAPVQCPLLIRYTCVTVQDVLLSLYGTLPQFKMYFCTVQCPVCHRKRIVLSLYKMYFGHCMRCTSRCTKCASVHYTRCTSDPVQDVT